MRTRWGGTNDPAIHATEHASDHSSNSAERPDRELTVIGNGNRDVASVGAPLHDDMTSAPAYLDEPVLLKDPTGVASRQDAKPTHASLRSSSRRHRSEADA
jgi:hypothetical protein